MSDSHSTEKRINDVKDSVLAALAESAAQVTPQFFENMPEDYFNSVDTETQISHLKALIATKLSGFSQDILLKSEDRTLFTFIIEKSYPGQLSELLHSLPHGKPLHTAKVFTAKNNSLILDIFHFGKQPLFDAADENDKLKMEEAFSYAKTTQPSLDVQDFTAHIHKCSKQYLHTVRRERLLQHYLIVSRIRGTNDTVVEIEHRDFRQTEVTIGIGLPNRRAMFERISRHFGKNGVDIRRAHLESFRRKEDGHSIAMLGFQVSCGDDNSEAGDRTDWQTLQKELARIFYLDEEVLDLAYADYGLSLLEAELLVAFTHLAHQLLLKADRLAYSRERIKNVLLKNLEITRTILSGFLQRFSESTAAAVDPEKEAADYLAGHLHSAETQRIIAGVARIPKACLATNLFFSSRYALSLRLEPSYLAVAGREINPFGLFFVCGRNFDGFHVRFQDIARGGVRIVRTTNPEVYAYETERHYDEAYGLARAQQLKNKDIPEGGAKGVILTKPEANIEFCGRAFADALLDLITPVQTGTTFVDHRTKQELLYLGPDENVSNSLINWIVERAQKRGYQLPRAFMSSKPGAGINHKEYGVTSEGVVVYLEAALKEIGLDPRQERFSVKLTGGPDGDVAGNCIRILFREFPETVQIVGIADGSGYAEDPEGLDREELSRLVRQSLPISCFAAAKLSAKGMVREAADPESIRLRNTLHNRIAADAFIPAGGRPRTLNGDNWREFLIAGAPSCRVIVEGANLFITPEAREQLSTYNLPIIRDSSANKCGVICSSFEIAASMLLSEEEFLEIKQEFVKEVIQKLRDLAALEAKLLMVERRHNGEVILPELSKQISEVIERSARAIAGIADRLPAATLTDLICAYLPATLIRKVGAEGIAKLPKQYAANLIAASLASRIVYREGLAYLESMSENDIATYALRYLEQEAATAAYVAEILGSTLPNKDRIAHLLKHGATRIAIEE